MLWDSLSPHQRMSISNFVAASPEADFYDPEDDEDYQSFYTPGE